MHTNAGGGGGRRRWLGALGAGITGALATAASAAPKLPTIAVPCAPGEITAAAQGEDVVACWADGCMQLDLAGDTAHVIDRPAARPAWTDPSGEIRQAEGKPVACVGATCKPIGPKLAAALAAARSSEAPLRVSATTDLKAVVIGASEAWSLAGDRPLVLRPPAEDVAGFADKPAVRSIEVAREWLVVHWSGCDAPCTAAQLVDSAGKNRGKSVRGGGSLLQLGPKLFAVISERSDVTLFDLGTGRARGAVALFGVFRAGDAVRLADGRLAIADSFSSGTRITVIDASDPDHPTAGAGRYLPSCKP
jgi:hypothetical protein